MSKAAEANALQRKIFSRWVNQKIASKGKKIADIVTDCTDGSTLIYLIEVLAEKEYDNWKSIKNNSDLMRVQSCSLAMKFVFDAGVEMNNPPDAKQITTGNETVILALCWAIMLKFMKLDEDDGSNMKFEDALRMWVQNQVQSYGLEITNMTKSFHDGKVFCALINKFRPKLVNYAQDAASGTPEDNLKRAFAAAEKYFGLEQYLSVGDIAKLDNKSMVVYASEYYYGIAEQRRVDLAAKRVVKLIDYTKENDRLKADYTTRASALRTRLDKVVAVLSDTEIENTMAGAVRRLGLFNDYRKNDKAYLFGEAFTLDSMDQTLARRLSSKKRPPFKAAGGCDVPAIMASITDVEHKEASQNVALHNELNRQIKLAKIFEQYSGKNNELGAWIATQKAYLELKLEILSVGAANFAINQLEAYFTAYAAVSAGLPAFGAWAKELLENKFEHSATVSSYEAAITAGMKDLEGKADLKKKIHADDLARETLKVQVRGWNDDHVTSHGKLQIFITSAKASLSVKEQVNSIKDAELHLGLTKAIHDERASLTSNIPPLKEVGAKILATTYKSEYSEWKFEYPDQVQDREKFVEDGFAELETLGTNKILVLEDDLARENFKEKVRQWNENHKLQTSSLRTWIAKSKTYVDTKEPCDSVENAQDNLVVHKAYIVNEKSMQDNDVVALQAQGKEILDAKYETKYSSYVFGTPEEVTGRETEVTDAFAYLNKTSAHKLLILEDDLAREEFRFKVKKWNEQHVRQHASLETWIGASKTYVDTKEPVDSVEKAQDNLVVIHAYLGSQKLMQDGDVKALQALGKDILTARYETQFSKWAFTTPEEVTGREQFVTSSFDYLVNTSTHKLAVLEDDLGREQFKFKLHLWDSQHQNQHSKLKAWIDVQLAYLAVEEPFDSIADAEKNLKNLAAYEADKADVTKINLAAFNRLGKEILVAEYKTSLSQWKWEAPQDVQAHLDYGSSSWSQLDGASASKKTKLDADLAKEIRKEELRVEWAKMSDEFSGVSRDACASAPNTMFGFVLEEVEAFAATLKAIDQGLTAKSSDLKGKYDPCWAEMLQLGVRTPENPYSKLTPDHMEKAQSDMAAALAARQDRFNTELEKQRADDKACRDLAGAVDPFVHVIVDNKGLVANCKEELEGLLAVIVNVAGEPQSGTLDQIKACQKVVDERNIIYNRHTLNNGVDADVQFTQYTEYIANKKRMTEDEIEFKQLRGLTKEQYAEMKTQFDQFDKDKSGFLDKKEFRSCLYSMGEERGKKEIEDILTKLGNGDAANVKIAYDGYKEFMIEQLGDTDTEDAIAKGLRLVNRQNDKCQWAIMLDVLDQDYLDYMKSTHEDNYTEWTASVFAR